jgi:glycosyltransferase involved in cell wall biosynthesis
MKVCFITSEVFVGKRRGGFGKLLRIVGRELVRRGFEVSVICWREPDGESLVEVDGMEILSYPYSLASKSSLKHIVDYARVIPLVRKVDADVYLSIDCMVETLIVELLKRDARHVIWAQDPFDWTDYQLLGSLDPNYRVSKTRFLTNRVVFGLAHRRADLILTSARFFVDKLRRLYCLDPNKIIYLPNPVDYIPKEENIKKSIEPVVCYLARMDPQKRYWLFFELAKQFPEIRFIAMGKPNIFYEDSYEEVVNKYIGLSNLSIKGFVSEEEKGRILDKCWIMVLPSIREGLPIAMLEALAHKCALLSSVNPDGLTERFGYWSRREDFAKGLKWLLEDDKWRALGEEGYKYVRKNHEMEKIINGLINRLEELSRRR